MKTKNEILVGSYYKQIEDLIIDLQKNNEVFDSFERYATLLINNQEVRIVIEVFPKGGVYEKDFQQRGWDGMKNRLLYEKCPVCHPEKIKKTFES